MSHPPLIQSKRTDESEEQLVTRAQEAVSQCRWLVGECAARWTERYARGRTDGDFGMLIGLTGDQVYQRRRVWETFAALRNEFASLKWSHFYAALNWDDAPDCLRWAEETRSTVAEMRAWRRAKRGEDLTVASLDEEEEVQLIPSAPDIVRVPAESIEVAARAGAHFAAAHGAPQEHLAGVMRQAGAEGDDYAPFRTGAGSVPTHDEPADSRAAPPEPPSTEQLAKRMAGALERCSKAMSPAFRREFRKLPEPVRERLFKAAADLAQAVAELS